MIDKDQNRERITLMLEDISTNPEIAETYIHQERDVHGFYRLSRNPQKVIHVQGYPGLSSFEEARFFARMMDYEKMQESMRKVGEINGNEHEAVIQNFPNFVAEIPYDSETLEKMLAENVSELRPTPRLS